MVYLELLLPINPDIVPIMPIIQPMTAVLVPNCCCNVGSIIPSPLKIPVHIKLVVHSDNTAIHPGKPPSCPCISLRALSLEGIRLSVMFVAEYYTFDEEYCFVPITCAKFYFYA